jgi:hypothetical protein
MSNPAYDAKVARRERTNDSISRSAELQTRDWIIDDLLAADYGATPQGTFHNADRLILRWERPDWFEFIPDPERPFAFTRASGETITPGRMITDGGSIPRWFWTREALSPWGQTPAFMVHDWEFDVHHAGGATKSFEAVRDTIAEALKTGMETGLTPKSDATFRAIYAGVSSWIAKRIWAGE